MHGVSAVAEVLKREGVEYLFAFPAQALIEECARIGIEPILCRQERVGMGIADGFSRTTNGKRLGVFAMQQGPGAENAYPGAAQAFGDNVPILLLPGGVATERAHISPEYDSVESYRTVIKYGARVNRIDRIPELMRRAFYQLRTGKGSPVLIEVPQDMWTAEYGDDLDYTPVAGNRTAPDPSDIEAIAQVLLSAEAPMIHAGQGIMYADATDDLVELAETLQIPVLTTMVGKSGFPENHPLSLGAAMRSGQKGASHFLKKADVIFGIGCSFTRTGFGPQVPEGKTILHSTNDPADINKDQRAAHSAVGDAKLVLRALIDEVKSRTNGSGRGMGRLSKRSPT